MERLDEEIRRGVRSDRIAVVAFTRAARDEVRTRLYGMFGLDEESCPWVRTIHSAAFKLLGLGPDNVLNDRRWAEFAKRHGYVFSSLAPGWFDLDDRDGELPCRTPDDLVRYVHAWGRNCRYDLNETIRRWTGVGVARPELTLFAKRLEAFKTENALTDFAGMLEEVIEQELCPDVEVVFVDEGQDLSPLQIAVVEQWIDGSERAYVAADDDQAIYVFQGASPAWITGLEASWPTELLTQSHRVPKLAHAFATSIIEHNISRVAKAYLPRDDDGSVRWQTLDEAIRGIDGTVSTFVLARNRMYLPPFARGLIENGVPFLVEGGGAPNPLGDKRIVQAILLGQAWIAKPDKGADAAELHALLHFVPIGSGLVKRGVKARVERGVTAGEPFSRVELVEDFNLGPLIELIKREGPLAVFTGLSASVRRYLTKLIDERGGIPQPKVRLTSIHGAKGREAELVIVIPSMSRATYADYLGTTDGFEAENRVFYVAVTRTLRDLVLVEPRSQRHYDFPPLPDTRRKSAATDLLTWIAANTDRQRDFEERLAIRVEAFGVATADDRRAAALEIWNQAHGIAGAEQSDA
jgi:superfamily I DNA/RNA helicase